MASVFILMCRRKLRQEKQFSYRNNPLDYIDEFELDYHVICSHNYAK